MSSEDKPTFRSPLLGCSSESHVATASLGLSEASLGEAAWDAKGLRKTHSLLDSVSNPGSVWCWWVTAAKPSSQLSGELHHSPETSDSTASQGWRWKSYQQ